MKVITGSAKGRKIKTAQNGVRPMAARVKKSVFDTLGDITDARVLDVFAGSGALGIESMSRGAVSVVFVEKSAHVADILAGNIKECGFEYGCEVICADYAKAASRLLDRGEKFDLVFIAPPYKFYERVSGEKLTYCFSPLLSQNGRIVIEYETVGETKHKDFGENCRTKKYGGTTVSIISPKTG